MGIIGILRDFEEFLEILRDLKGFFGILRVFLGIS